MDSWPTYFGTLADIDTENGLAYWFGLRDGNSNSMHIAVGALCAFVVCWLSSKLLSWFSTRWKIRRLRRTVPRVRGGWPFLGQGLELTKGAPWDVMTRWAMEYGWIYRFTLFGNDNVVISDPAYMKEVMRNKMTMYHKDVEMAYKPFLSLLGTGIVTSDGPHWRKQRNKVSAAFRIEVLSEVPGMSQRAVERLSKKLDKLADTGESIEIGEELRHLTLQVISEALLSLSAEEADGTFAVVYMPIVVEGHKRTWNPLRRFAPFLRAFWSHRTNQKILNDYITDIILRRWDLIQSEKKRKVSTNGHAGISNGHANGTGGAKMEKSNGNGHAGEFQERRRDILDKVLAALEPGEWGPAIVRQIRDEVKTFVLAGHETSASMLNWSLYELLKNDDLMSKVVTESEAVLGPRVAFDAPLPNVEQLRGLQFTEACLREALRKYSVVPLVVRRCIRDTTICGDDGLEHFIPQGSVVHLMIKGVHEREDIWPDPKRYNPSRFLQEIAPYTFLPFIDGPRNCLGQHLSLLESKVVLALLANRYEFSLVNRNAGEPNKWIVPTIPLHGTHLTVKIRP